MPYFFDENLDEQQNPGAEGGVQISGASPTTDSEGNASPQGGKKQNTGSGFQNLDAYLQNNDAKGFGQQVVGKVQSDVDTAKKNQSDASGAFLQQVQGANNIPTQTQIDNAVKYAGVKGPTGSAAQPTPDYSINPVSTGNPGSNQLDNAQASSSANDYTPVTPEQYQSWEKQQYSGPKSLEDSQANYNQFWSGTNQAQTNSNLLGTEGGRFTLLDSYFGNPSYNQGQKSLDNLLLQQSGTGAQQTGLRNQAAQLVSQGNATAGNLSDAAATQAGKVEQSRNAALQAVGIDAQGNVITGYDSNGNPISGQTPGALGQLYNTVNQRTSQANQTRSGDIAKFENDLRTGQLTPEELQTAGLSQGDSIYNLDPTQYFSAGGVVNNNQTMTPEERARIQALSQLAGITDTFAANPAQPLDAAYGFDKARFQNDLNSTKSAFEQESQNNLNQALYEGFYNSDPTVYNLKKGLGNAYDENKIKADLQLAMEGAPRSEYSSDPEKLQKALATYRQLMEATTAKYNPGNRPGFSWAPHRIGT